MIYVRRMAFGAAFLALLYCVFFAAPVIVWCCLGIATLFGTYLVGWLLELLLAPDEPTQADYHSGAA